MTTIRTFRSGHSRGFTFLEVMVVVLVIGVMAALVLPNLGGVTDGARLRSSARNLANLMKVARTEAILGNRTTEVWLDLSKHTYRLDLLEPEGEGRAERLTSSITRNKRRNIEQLRNLETRIRFDAVSATSQQIIRDTEVVIRFFRDGSATPTKITLISHRGKKSTMEVLRLTGLVDMDPESQNNEGEGGGRER